MVRPLTLKTQPMKNYLAPGTFGCKSLFTALTPPTQRSNSMNLFFEFRITII